MGPTLRVVIIGNSGAGKSHRAKALAAEHGLQHLDLDTLVWEPGQIAVQRAATAVADDLARVTGGHDRWVVEGCYGDVVTTLDNGEVELIWLDPGVEACLDHCRQRPWEPHKYATKQAQDDNLAMLLEWVRGYETRQDAWSRHGHRAAYDAWTGPRRHEAT